MKVIDCDIEGLKILEPRVFPDNRGYFFESFSEREFKENVSDTTFVQDNESCSTKGVVRGLHFQVPPFAQAKLVRCVMGEVIDIAMDIRKGSPTFGKHVAVLLSGDNHRQFFIPHGFAHGIIVLSEMCVFHYKCDNYYAPKFEGGINILDPELDIMKIKEVNNPIFSAKDTRHPDLKNFDSPFILGVNC